MDGTTEVKLQCKVEPEEFFRAVFAKDEFLEAAATVLVDDFDDFLPREKRERWIELQEVMRAILENPAAMRLMPDAFDSPKAREAALDAATDEEIVDTADYRGLLRD